MITTRRTVLAALGAAASGSGRPADLASSDRVASAAPSPAARRSARRTLSRWQEAPAAAALVSAQVVARYGHLRPHTWGFGGPGVVRDLHTSRRLIALTFDACGGPGGSGYDQTLIGFLRRREVPATLFLNSRWIDAHPAVFRQLAAEPLFRSPATAPGICPCRLPGGPLTASPAPRTPVRSRTRSPGTRPSSPSCWASHPDCSGQRATATTSRPESSPPWTTASSAPP